MKSYTVFSIDIGEEDGFCDCVMAESRDDARGEIMRRRDYVVGACAYTLREMEGLVLQMKEGEYHREVMERLAERKGS